MRVKKFKTDVLINNDVPPYDDLAFIRSRNYKPTALLRMKIHELKARSSLDTPNSDQLLKRIENLENFQSDCLLFLEQNNLTDKFFKFINKEDNKKNG